jgi:hypothetical protein
MSNVGITSFLLFLNTINYLTTFDAAINPCGIEPMSEDYVDPKQKIESENEGSGCFPENRVGSRLEKIRDAHRLPTTYQSHVDRLIVFSSLGVDKDAITEEIPDMKKKGAARCASRLISSMSKGGNKPLLSSGRCKMIVTTFSVLSIL